MEISLKINTCVAEAGSRIGQKVKLNCGISQQRSQTIPWGASKLRWLFRVVLISGKEPRLSVSAPASCYKQCGRKGTHSNPDKLKGALDGGLTNSET